MTRDQLNRMLADARIWQLDAPADRAADPIPPRAHGFVMPALEDLQRFVGGYIEFVPLLVDEQPAALIVNEDGRGRLPVNYWASLLFFVGAGNELHLGAEIPEAFTIAGPAWLWIGPLPEDA